MEPGRIEVEADAAAAVSVPAAPTGLARVLLRLPNWVGDVVMAGPAVRAIREALPAATLVAQVRPALLGLARLLPGVDEGIPAGPDRGPGSLLASRRRLREHDFEAAVIFPRGARSQLAPRLAGIGVRIGFGARGQGWLLTHAVEGWRPWRRRHRSAFFGLLARAFGREALGVPTLAAPPEARQGAVALLRGLGRRPQRPLVALEPGAAYGPAKCWPAERFGDLAARLLADGVDVVTVGVPSARRLEDAVAERAGSGLLRAVGRTADLPALAGLLAEADLLVTNDTGPMHVAAALGTPVLALFGATDPVVSGPKGPGPHRLLWEPEPCSPCFLRRCAVPGHPCLDRFGAGRVFEEARAMLAAAGRGA